MKSKFSKKIANVKTNCNEIFRTMNSKEINILSSVWCWKKCTAYLCPKWLTIQNVHNNVN